MNPKRNRARDVGFYVLLLLILAAVIFTMTRDTEPESVEHYSDLVDLFKQEKVQSFRTEGNKIVLQLRTDDPAKTEEKVYDLYSFNVFYNDFSDLIKEQHESGVLKEYDYNEGFVVPWWASIIPYLILMGGAMALAVWHASARRGPASAARRRTRRPSPMWPAVTRKKKSWPKSSNS